MRKLTTCFAFLLLAFTAPAFAQTITGSIGGQVTDGQGGALPGAIVTLTSKVGSKTTTTESDGTYRFFALDPGTYELRVELASFRPNRESNISLGIGRQLTIDFVLAVGGVTETLDVVSESPVVDVTSSSSENSISQDLLFNLPISRTNAAVNLLNNAPGVNSGAAFGGDANSGNALMLDGVDTRDPEGGTAWTFFNYNIVEEVQVGGLGAPAEYGAFTGAFVNTVTRSGGNRFGGLFDINYTDGSDALSSSNITDDIKRQNPALADPAKEKKLVDFTVQLSGPIIREELYFFASAQRYRRTTDPTGPVTTRHEVSPRLNLKLTWQPSPNDHLTGTFQADDYNITGRPGVPALLATDDITNQEDAPELLWLAQWRHLFGAKTFTEVKYTGWWGYFDLNPDEAHRIPGHLDGATGQYSVSQGWYAYYDRGRHQLNATVTHFADAFGKHDLKFGVEIERSRVRNRYGYFDDIFFYDYDGVPYLAYQYSYDVSGKNHRESFFVQDSWKVNDRLTVNAGARMDWNRGVHDPQLASQQDVGKVYETKNLAPRLGAALDLTGDNKTVLKATYGHYYEGAFFSLWSSAIPGIEDFVLLDVSACPGHTTPSACKSFAVEADRSPNTLYKIDPDLKHPRVDELTLGIERALTKDFSVSLTGIYRDFKNAIGSVFPDATWAPTNVTSTDTSGFPSRPLTVYRWVNRSASEENILITNPDGFVYSGAGTASTPRKYKGLMAVLSKRLSNRWQAQISYVVSRAEGVVNNTGSTTFGTGRFFQTPTRAIVNSNGPLTNDRTHEFKAYVSYQVPVVDVGVNAIVQSVTGGTYAAFQRFGSAAINFPFSAGREPFLEARGSRRVDRLNTVDLRLDKYFKVGAERKSTLSFYVDVQNLLNKTIITNRQARVPNVSIAGVPDPVAFNAPTGVNAARQITLGARWSY
jgi:hypothetical protein